MGYRLQCPGVTSYGKGHLLTSVHIGGCCDRFAALSPEEQQATGGWRVPTGDEPPAADPHEDRDWRRIRRILRIRTGALAKVFDAVSVHYDRKMGAAPALSTDPPNATTEECLAALTFTADARDLADLQEMCLIAWLRADGCTWERIGQALGYKPTGLRQGASARYEALRRRWPDYTPPPEKRP